MFLALPTIAVLLSNFYKLLSEGCLELPDFIVARLGLLFARLKFFGVSMELLADGFLEVSLALECWLLRWVSLQVGTGAGCLEVVLSETSG